MHRPIRRILVVTTIICLFLTSCNNSQEPDIDTPDSLQASPHDTIDSGEKDLSNSTQSEAKTEVLLQTPTEKADTMKPDKIISEEETMPDLMIPELNIRPYAIPQSEALAFTNQLGLGWNLGNTFDAANCDWLSDEMDYESAWNGTKTTFDMLKDIRNAGFSTIRIPVSWHNHVETPEYIISDQWMTRVKEVVDWAIELDFHVIINMHHDTEKSFVYPDKQHYEQSTDFAVKVWQQISETFIDYDERLVFELLNEPRLKDTDLEWNLNINDPRCLDAVDIINRLNQDILDTVRATGGNNASRFLMVPGYVASPESALHDGFLLPTDTIKDRLIVSVHTYSPYEFALMPSSNPKSRASFDLQQASSTSYISKTMTDLYNRYILKGIPVIIGEWGSVDRDGNTQARINHAAYFAGQAYSKGIPCIWWDNNTLTGDGERFAIYLRRNGTFPFPEIIDAMKKYSSFE